jgi:hypothetical protein
MPNIHNYVAHYFSFILHPIFIPVYTVLLYFYVTPVFFFPQNITFLSLYLLIVSVIIPLLFIAVMIYSKAFKSISLDKPEERFLVSGIMLVVYIIILKKISSFHQYIELFPFFLGIIISLFVLLIYNYLKQKPSIHATSMAGCIGFFLIWSYYTQVNILFYISIIILLTAIVIAARLFLKKHTANEVIRGLLIGLLAQIIAFYISLHLF